VQAWKKLHVQEEQAMGSRAGAESIQSRAAKFTEIWE
jgi:hypothetical protein